MLQLEPSPQAGGSYEMVSFEIRQGAPLLREVVLTLAREAATLNREMGDPQAVR